MSAPDFTRTHYCPRCNGAVDLTQTIMIRDGKVQHGSCPNFCPTCDAPKGEHDYGDPHCPVHGGVLEFDGNETWFCPEGTCGHTVYGGEP